MCMYTLAYSLALVRGIILKGLLYIAPLHIKLCMLVSLQSDEESVKEELNGVECESNNGETIDDTAERVGTRQQSQLLYRSTTSYLRALSLFVYVWQVSLHQVVARSSN